MKPKRRLTHIFFLMLAGVALSSILLIGALWISFEANRSALESEKIRDNYFSSQQDSISLETNRICDYIEAQRQANEVKFLKNLKERVLEAHQMLTAIAGDKSLKMDEEARKAFLISSLKSITWDEGRGRYVLTDMEGENLFGVEAQQFENLSLTSSDYNTRDDFSEVARSVTAIKEGFYHFNLNRNRIDDLREWSTAPISFIKYFEPYKWLIGTGEYLDEFENEVQKDLLDWASSMPMPNEKYLMILTYDGDLLSYPDPEREGTNIFLDNSLPAFEKDAAEIIRGAKEHTKDFKTFNDINNPNLESGKRIAYYRSIPDWRWVVVTWVYFKDLEAALADQQAILAGNVRKQIYNIIGISVSMLLLILLLSRVVSSLATKSFAAFFTFFEQASTASLEINPDEQPFAEFARLAVAANNMITQRKLAEKLLRESELKFKTIFDVSPQVITISDFEGRLLDANEEYNKFSSEPLSRALGRPLADTFILSKEQQQEFWSELKSANHILGREIEGKGADGSPVNLLAFGKTINLGSSYFVLAIFANISALKTAENEKLVLQEKLARSKKMEAMGLMAAEVAHDLNNILSGIIGYPQLLLLEPNITSKQKAVITEILETGQKAAAVVSDLLTIARGVATIKESVPINSIVAGYIASPEYKKLVELFPKIKLLSNLDPEAGNIICSQVHLTKIIMNLVSNAFEAMPLESDSSQVTIKTEKVTLTAESLPNYENVVPGPYAKVSIIDNGPGIPKGDLDKIFEPFYSKKMKGRSGTGLGLAIVWNTIQDHGGYLDVTSSENGTSFILYFKQTVEKTAMKDNKKQLDEYKGHGERILVVDDVEIQRKLASKMLSTLGYEPIAVPSGESAVDFLKNEDVDLVILDMIMHPGMNGRETYAAIMEFKPGQKAIIASGMAETEEVAKAQALGAGQFVNKPYTIEDIALAVQKALQP